MPEKPLQLRVPGTHLPPDPVSERGEPTDRLFRFVEELMTKGFKKLHSPPHLQGREFFVTCRTAANPNHPDKLVSPEQFNPSDLAHSWATHFTEAVVLDLFEAMPPGSEQLVPVGHTDVNIASLSAGDDGLQKVMARRDMSVTQRYKDAATPVLAEPFKTAVVESDKIWRINATDVVDSVQRNTGQLIWIGDMAKLLDKYGVAPDTSWRKLGFGSLLTGLQLEVLQQKKAQVLELPSSAAGVREIFNKMRATNPAAGIENDAIDLSKVHPRDYVALVEPFIP